MKVRITTKKLEMLESFEDYVARGGSILSFADYYVSSNNCEDFNPEKYLIILALCEELAIAGDHQKIFDVLNTVFSVERWTLKSFKQFMACVRDSEPLRPFYQAIFALHENCKNYIKSM